MNYTNNKIKNSKNRALYRYFVLVDIHQHLQAKTFLERFEKKKFFFRKMLFLYFYLEPYHDTTQNRSK